MRNLASICEYQLHYKCHHGYQTNPDVFGIVCECVSEQALGVFRVGTCLETRAVLTLRN